MIEFVSFVLLLLLVVLRGPQAITGGVARPAWVATGLGALSLLTFGAVVPTRVLDGLLGDVNLLTLVRDLAATAAFWFFRESVASYSKSPRRNGRLALLALLGSFTLPFFLIDGREGFDPKFIENGVGRLAVCTYGVVYMSTIAWLSASSIVLARRRQSRTSTVFVAGYSLVIGSAVIEIGYLTLAHLDFGGTDFRTSLYFASEIPFFLGVLVITSGILAVTFRARFRAVQFAHRLDEARLRRLLPSQEPNRFPDVSSPRQRVYELLARIEESKSQKGRHLTQREVQWIDRAQKRVTLPGAPDPIRFDRAGTINRDTAGEQGNEIPDE